jgi:RNA polymerase sigma-70 factor (ECF subfamily)
MQLDDHFFRREAGKLTAALTRAFGVHRLALVEDVVQDAFARAVEVWRVRGIPEHPTAWLLTTARNRAIDILRREQRIGPTDPSSSLDAFEPEILRDEQLRMMFSCCHPRVPEETQLALVLNLLCGFSAEEIAHALLRRTAAIEKRIARGKRALAEARALFDLSAVEFEARLDTVRSALYLLFNEGYHGAACLRHELCEEALRLTLLLRAHPPAATPTTHALAALMCLHAARLPARFEQGELRSLAEQDRARWDERLLAEGLALFEASARGDRLSPYHIEAAIAATHAAAASFAQTDWSAIVALYDRLLSVRDTPVVALNRAIALGELRGPDAGLAALYALDASRLAAYPFLPAAIAELELRRGDLHAARKNFEAALLVARNDAERSFLERRLRA